MGAAGDRGARVPKTGASLMRRSGDRACLPWAPCVRGIEPIFRNDFECLAGGVGAGFGRGRRVSERVDTHPREGRYPGQAGSRQGAPRDRTVSETVRNCPKLSERLGGRQERPSPGGVRPSWRRVVTGTGEGATSRWTSLVALEAATNPGQSKRWGSPPSSLHPHIPGTFPPRPVTLPLGCPAAPSAP